MSDSPDFVLSCPVPLPPGERILLGHGSGGVLTHRLITDLFAPVFGDTELSRLGDAAVLDLPSGDSGVHSMPNAGQSWGLARPRNTSPAMQTSDSLAGTDPSAAGKVSSASWWA